MCTFLIYILLNRINPQNEAAKKGLERLEKQMKVRFMLLLWPDRHASLSSLVFAIFPSTARFVYPESFGFTFGVEVLFWSNVMLVLAVQQN